MARVFILIFIMLPSVFSQDLEENLDSLTFDDLMDIKVVSFDGTPKKWKKTPAAIHVISKEDIANSSARSIPDLLRSVPGMHVAQIDAHTWAISSRGFTRRYSNKLLVLVDGRSIYTPLFSGVHWDLIDLPLSTIERIEVIRGPGGTLWGANAVNGVINIITKSSIETQGSYLKLGVGNIEQGFGTYRFGEIIEENNLAYRITLSGNNKGHFKSADDSSSKDDWRNIRLSSRVDWEPTDKDKILFSGGTYFVDSERDLNTVSPLSTVITPVREDDLHSYGYHFLSRWDRELDTKSSFFAQVYYDSYYKENPGYSEGIDTYDVELRYTHELNKIHKISLGTGYRIVRDDFNSDEVIEFNPNNTQKDTFRIYGQDEISLIKNELVLILGTKYERNDHTGTEWQPSAKLIWTPNEINTFWTSISRAVRTPSRTDDDVVNRIFFAGANEFNILGDRDLESERLIAYELGYRYTPADKPLSLDLTLFYNDYNHLNDVTNTGTSFIINDDAEGYSVGAEAFIAYQVTDMWKIKSSYSFIESKFSGGNTFTGSSPQHLASLMSEYKVNNKISLFQNLYFTDQFSSPQQSINDQYRFDLGVSWQVSESLRMSAWALNLLDSHTLEFADEESANAETPRSFYIQLEYNF
ncbi:MAG: TonB-dependent receptor [Lentisphaeraceae bacterium]|nr:TonB-dependent receptor [Lentisphaeraceae bacterium]